jgi:hypothetical protein
MHVGRLPADVEAVVGADAAAQGSGVEQLGRALAHPRRLVLPANRPKQPQGVRHHLGRGIPGDPLDKSRRVRVVLDPARRPSSSRSPPPRRCRPPRWGRRHPSTPAAHGAEGAPAARPSTGSSASPKSPGEAAKARRNACSASLSPTLVSPVASRQASLSPSARSTSRLPSARVVDHHGGRGEGVGARSRVETRGHQDHPHGLGHRLQDPPPPDA